MSMSDLSRITIDPEVCHGKPCVRDLRYPVEMIIDLLSSKMSVAEILADYEDLEEEDIFACLKYASEIMHVESIERVAI